MERGEVMQRVIGILTRAADLRRLLEEDVDRTDLEDEPDVVGAMLGEVFSTLVIRRDATPDEIAADLGEQLGLVLNRLTMSFSAAWLSLAAVHDASAPEITSADVLQQLALRAIDGEFDM